MAAGLSLAVCWSYLGTMREPARVWCVKPTYSHGYLVAAAAYLLWQRRLPAGGCWRDVGLGGHGGWGWMSPPRRLLLSGVG